MSLKPIICKHCKKVISPAPVIVGEPETVRMGKTIQKLAKHINARAQEEEQQGIAGANGQAFRPGPHHAAVIRVQLAMQGITELSIAANFDLSEDLEAAVDDGKRGLHEQTRTVRMTDEDLGSFLDSWLHKLEKDRGPHLLGIDEEEQILRDLRDRYEGLGKYSPSPAEVNPPFNDSSAAATKHTN